MQSRIKRPTAEEISAILSPSPSADDPALVEIVRPAYDYLLANLGTDKAVSAYVSDRITSELLRLSRMKAGRSNFDKVTPEQRAKNAKAGWAKRSAKEERRVTVRVRAFYRPHKAFLALSPNMRERTTIAGVVVTTACDDLDRDALRAYCARNCGKPAEFVTIPLDAVNRAKVIAREESVPFTKVICYILDGMS